MAKKEKQGLARILEQAGEPSSGLAAGVILAILSAVLEFIPILAVFLALDSIADLPIAHSVLGDRGPMSVALVAAGATADCLLLGFLSSMLCHGYAFRTICAIRIKLVNHLKTLPISYFKKNPSGKIVQVVQTDVDQLEGFLAHQFPDFVSTMALLLLLIAGMIVFDVRLALVAVAVLIIGFLGQFVPMVMLLRTGAMRENFDALERISTAATEYVHGMPSIKMFGQTPRSFAGFQDDIEAYRDFTSGLSKKIGVGVTFFRTVVISIATFLAPVALAFLLSNPSSGRMLETVLFFLVFAPAATMPVCKLRSFAEGMNMLGESVSRIEKILDEQPLEASAAKDPTTFDIKFEHVGFSYTEADGAAARQVLEDVSFVATQGGLTAIVGPSGAGKSTIAQIICRFWDPVEGAVHIGDIDVRNISEGRMADLVSFVFQDSHVFSMSVADNIRLARPEATDEEVAEAARAACCEGFVSELPKGMATVVGDGGIGLSGGERQRIAIARAFLKDSPILVLDEPTSAMDADTEREVQTALSRLARGRTVIMIAHRLPTVAGADSILVMDKGRIVERGTHDELLKRDGLYRKLWEASKESASWDAGRR